MSGAYVRTQKYIVKKIDNVAMITVHNGGCVNYGVLRRQKFRNIDVSNLNKHLHKDS